MLCIKFYFSFAKRCSLYIANYVIKYNLIILVTFWKKPESINFLVVLMRIIIALIYMMCLHLC